MTYVARRTMQRLPKAAFLLLGMGLIVSTLGGCGGGVSISSLGSALGNDSSDGGSQEGQVQKVAAKPIAPIAFAPVFGPPVQVAKKLSGALESEAQVRSITVVKGGTKPEYTIRGYLSASPDKNGTKLSYIWDVTNPSGKRAHRIKGEEIVPGPQNSKDPWALIDQSAIQAIAAKTATRLASWLPSGGGTTSGLVQQASLRSSGSATRTVPTRNAVAVIPSVKGAPGDGSEALAKALRKQLSSKGIKVASVGQASNPFKVIGIVNLTSAGNNQQKIKIEWIVKDPRNKKLGTVTQKNVIPAGSLDRAWGGTADAAASAAAQGIAKLIKN